MTNEERYREALKKAVKYLNCLPPSIVRYWLGLEFEESQRLIVEWSVIATQSPVEERDYCPECKKETCFSHRKLGWSCEHCWQVKTPVTFAQADEKGKQS